MKHVCTSGKVGHRSVAMAKIAARTHARHLNEKKILAESEYTYRCGECHRWHLTRRSTWDGKPLILAHEASPEALQRWAMGES